MIRIFVFPNGSRNNGKVVDVETNSWDNVLQDIRLVFMDMDISRIFTHDGTEISCMEQLREAQTVFVSGGEEFTHLVTGSIQSQQRLNNGRGTINSLPDEIIEMILKQLSVKDLLNVRLSCWRCLLIATLLSRLHGGTLRSSWFKDPHRMDIFKPYATYVPPWSSYSLGDLSVAAPALQQKFCQELGHYLLNVKICPVKPQNIDIVQWTPNLRSLEVGPARVIQKNATGLPPNPNGLLSNLKKLKLDIHHGNIELLEFLISTTTKPQSLDINLSLTISDSTSAQKVATSLEEIPFITLTMVFPKTEILTILGEHELKIRKLNLQASDIEIPETVTFISTLSQYLTHLNIGIRVAHGVPQSLAFTPTLPILKTFKIDFNSTYNSPSIWRNFIQSFSMFHPAQVPILQEFSISARGPYTRKKVFHSGPFIFESVRTLEVVNLNYLDDDWFRHFPNVKKMTVEGQSGDFKKILKRMTSLEHLVLKMKCLGPRDADINDILAGRKNAAQAYDQIQQLNRKIPLNVQKMKQFRAPILSLTAIKKFEFEMEREHDEETWVPNGLEDCGVYFSMLKIHPLKLLRLRNVSISLEMEDQLKKRHEVFIREYSDYLGDQLHV